jgi:hypothetical protein
VIQISDLDPKLGSRSVIHEPKKAADIFAICKNPVQIQMAIQVLDRDPLSMNPKRQPTFLLFARTLFKFASRADRNPSCGSRSVIHEPKKAADFVAICKDPVQIRIKSRRRSKYWIAIRYP